MVGRPPSARPLIAQLHKLTQLRLHDAHAGLLDRRRKLRFDFTVQPTALSREYRCRLTLSTAGFDPEAYVLSPDLQELSGATRPPHIYDYAEGRTRLCLYSPGSDQWTSQSWLSETMLPWTVSWLRFYEIWLATGKWEGDGDHPSSDPIPPRRRYGMAARRR